MAMHRTNVKTLSLLMLCILASAITLSPSTYNTASASSTTPSPGSAPNAVCPAGGQCFADVLPGSTFYEFANNLYKQDIISGYACGGAGEPCDDQNRPYYRPNSDVTRAQMTKFVDNARHMPGIHIETETDPAPFYSYTGNPAGIGVEGVNGAFTGTGPGVRGATASFSTGAVGVLGLVVPTNPGAFSAGVRGINNGTGSTGIGVYGSHAGSGAGVYGTSVSGVGVGGYTTGTSSTAAGVTGSAGGQARAVLGINTSQSGGGVGVLGIHQSSGTGVGGNSASGVGVFGTSAGNSEDGIGVYGSNSHNAGYAGYFFGNVGITGICTGCAGPVRIDHPLDPANRYLYHSSVESPDMKNIYDGVVVLDGSGSAVISMPDYFEALNQDFRYQLSAIGAPMPNLYVAQKVNGNVFRIAGGVAGMEVSWQVTGIRHDPYSVQNPVAVEQDKADADRGMYVHPEAYDQPDSLQIGALPLP